MNLFWQFICTIAFGAACWGVGDTLLDNFLGKKVVLSALARHTLAFVTGNVAISYLLTALGFIGGFIPTVLWTVFIMGIGIAIWRVAREFRKSPNSRLVNPTIQEETQNGIAKERGGQEVAYIFLMVIIGIFFVPPILQAAAPPYVRDSLVYHLLCPKEYLRAGRLVHVEGNVFSAFPKGHEVLMTLLLSNGGDRAAQGFSILQQIAAIGELYTLTRLMAGPLSAALCAIGYATVPPVMYFTGCGYVEPALLMSLGGSLLVLFLCLRSETGTSVAPTMCLGHISLLGFLSGWMSALKYSGLIYLGLIGMILMWRCRRVPSKKGLTMLGVLSLSAAPGLCWMGWNWLTLGNPVYPMAWFLFGGQGWEEAQALAMSLYFDAYGMGRNFLDYLLLPWRLAFLGRFDTIRFDGAIGPFLIMVVISSVASAMFLVRRRLIGGMVKEIGLMFVVSAAFFMFGTQQTRFWLPSQMLACAFAAPSVDLLVNWARGKHPIKIILFLVLIGSFGWNMWFLGNQFFAVGYYKPVLGMEQERDFLIRKVPGYAALEFINQNLPPDSRLLCVWTGAYGYYINRKYYSDTFIEDVTLKGFIHKSVNGKELSQRLTQAGFTHLFGNLSILEKNTEQSERVIFGQFLKEEARELFRYQSYVVFQILR
jgi:uncharacterized membrane protein YbaN (DUF454 family)